MLCLDYFKVIAVLFDDRDRNRAASEVNDYVVLEVRRILRSKSKCSRHCLWLLDHLHILKSSQSTCLNCRLFLTGVCVEESRHSNADTVDLIDFGENKLPHSFQNEAYNLARRKNFSSPSMIIENFMK